MANLHAVTNVQLVGASWDKTPALDKGLVIGGGAAFLLGSVLGLSGQRLGAKIAIGTSAAVALALLTMGAARLGHDVDLAADDGSRAFTDVVGGGAILAGVTTALMLMSRQS